LSNFAAPIADDQGGHWPAFDFFDLFDFLEAKSQQSRGVSDFPKIINNQRRGAVLCRRADLISHLIVSQDFRGILISPSLIKYQVAPRRDAA